LRGSFGPVGSLFVRLFSLIESSSGSIGYSFSGSDQFLSLLSRLFSALLQYKNLNQA
jgi:hypothetical protein